MTFKCACNLFGDHNYSLFIIIFIKTFIWYLKNFYFGIFSHYLPYIFLLPNGRWWTSFSGVVVATYSLCFICARTPKLWPQHWMISATIVVDKISERINIPRRPWLSSLKVCIPFIFSYTHLSSPTMRIGILWLNAIRVNLLLFLLTIDWMQIGLYLFTFKSNTWTLPSSVTAENTVLEYGAHSTSPTAQPKSNTNSGVL